MRLRGPPIVLGGADITPTNFQSKVLVPLDEPKAHTSHLPHLRGEHFEPQVIDVKADFDWTLRTAQPLFPILHENI